MDHVSIYAWEWKPHQQHRDLLVYHKQSVDYMSGICKTSYRIRISHFPKRNSAKLSDSSSSSGSNLGTYKSYYGKSRFFDTKRSYRTTNSSSLIKPSLWLIRSRFQTFLKAIARATSRKTKTRLLLKTTHCLTLLSPTKDETLDPTLLGLRRSSSCISLSMLKVPNVSLGVLLKKIWQLFGCKALQKNCEKQDLTHSFWSAPRIMTSG